MKQYQDLLKHVLENGTRHKDRTGVGTTSVFGYQTRFDLRNGFPIVTTKKVPFRWIAEELFWFLSGDTSEKNLQMRGVDIWAEWADETHTIVLRIEKFQNENGHLFEKVQNLEEQLKIERELRESLDKSVNLLKKKTSICKANCG